VPQLLYSPFWLRNSIEPTKMVRKQLLVIVFITCLLCASTFVIDKEPVEHSPSVKIFRSRLFSRLRRQFPQVGTRRNPGDTSQVGGLSGRGGDEWGKGWGGRVDTGGRRDDIRTDDGRGGAVGRVRQPF